MNRYIRGLDRIIRKNEYGMNGRSKYHKVNIENWQYKTNCGDVLGPIICKWILGQRGIDIDREVSSTKHLMTVGSIIGSGRFDSTVWGSGLHMAKNVQKLYVQRRRYDIRALRGPVTAEYLSIRGYSCNAYGDPAILMNKIYKPVIKNKKYDFSIIPNYSLFDNYIDTEYHVIDMGTSDYEHVIDQIVASNYIISSSLHGIILAETYGIPAVFMMDGMEKEMMKFYDWYYSTGRYTVKVARGIAEAIDIGPMEEIRGLVEMQDRLLEVFPEDLWEAN